MKKRKREGNKEDKGCKKEKVTTRSVVKEENQRCKDEERQNLIQRWKKGKQRLNKRH